METKIFMKTAKYSIALCAMLIIYVVNAQDLNETLNYINHRIGPKAEISLTENGIIKIFSDDIYSMSPFDVQPLFNQYDLSVYLKCRGNQSCMSCRSCFPKDKMYFEYKAETSDEVKSLKNAFSYLIELAKDIYSKYQIEQAKIDPFANNENWGNRVQLTPKGDLFEVPVELNGVLKIKFLLDTGASDVFLSPDVFITLYRSGTLNDDDFICTKEYTFANGTTEECKIFKLKSIKIGNKKVENIECAIANSINVEMLLGQSFLQKLGNYSIDNANNLLIIE